MKYNKIIVVLTCGMSHHPGLYGRWHPDIEGRMRLWAGVERFRQSREEGKSPLLIIAGGKTYGPNNPSLSLVLRRKAIDKYDIPKESVVAEERSIDTSENAEYTRDIIRNNLLYGSVELVTSGNHLGRSLDCFRRYGLNPEGFRAEEVLSGRDKRLGEVLQAWKNSYSHFRTTLKEFAIRGFMRFIGVGPIRNEIHRRIDEQGQR